MAKINEKKVEEQEEKPYPINVSDWITFLGNKSSTNVSLLVFAGSVSIIALITLYETIKDLPLFFKIVVFLFVYFIVIIVIMYMGNRTKPYQDLLEEIMEGRISNPINIRKKYKKTKEDLEKKWWKIKKDR